MKQVPRSNQVLSFDRSAPLPLQQQQTNMPALPSAKKRVAIVGGGAAGCNAAYAMSLSPELFEVTMFERASVLGGMATSTEIGELLTTLNTSGTIVPLDQC